MVVGVFEVQRAPWVVVGTVVRRAEAHEAVLQRVVASFVPVVVAYHVLFAGETLRDGDEKVRMGKMKKNNM